MQELSRRERTADESCRNFAAARAESQATVAALKAELSICNAELQRAQGQLNMLGSSEGVLQRLEATLGRVKRRGGTIARVVKVSAARCGGVMVVVWQFHGRQLKRCKACAYIC